MATVSTVKDLHLMRQSTSSQEGTDPLRRSSLPVGRQSSQESAQSQSTSDPASTGGTTHKLVRSTSTDSILESTAEQRQKSVGKLECLENGGDKIPRSGSCSEGLNLTPETAPPPQKTGSVGNLIETHSKVSSQVGCGGGDGNLPKFNSLAPGRFSCYYKITSQNIIA